MPADPLPPARPAPTTSHPILSPPENGKFFVLASCIFHACVKPEADPRTHVKTPMIQTARCPPNLRIFAKDNLGFNNAHPGYFMNTVLSMMRNQMKASDIVKTTANASLDHCDNICKEHKREMDVRLARADFSTQTKMKGMVKTECSRTREEIIALTHHALDAAKSTADPFNGIAVVLNHADRCNWLLQSLTFKTMSQPVSVSGTSNQLDIANFVSYGAPKTRYLPTKTYHLTKAVPKLDPRASAEERFIHRAIEGHLHLTVGLRLDDRVHTLQANVDLSAFANAAGANAAGAKNSIAMHEIVQVLMDPRMKARVAELMCKQDQLPCERLQELEWDVALFDGGCSGIMGPSGYPDTIHVPSSGKGRKQFVFGKRPEAVPSKQASQPNAVSWDVESPRPASDTLAVRLRKKAKTYLSPGEPLHSLSVFSQTPSAPRSNESTTAEPPSSPRTSDLEGGKTRRSTTPKKSKSQVKSKSKSPNKRGYLTSTKSEK